MKLKNNVDIPSFLDAVQKCDYDVLFITGEGDQLSLKSTLSQFVFTAVIAGMLSKLDGTITFNPKDLIHLANYLAE